jgi:hypothetical protein
VSSSLITVTKIGKIRKMNKKPFCQPMWRCTMIDDLEFSNESLTYKLICSARLGCLRNVFGRNPFIIIRHYLYNIVFD